MNKSAEILELAKWHLAEQERRIQQQKEMIEVLAGSGVHEKAKLASDKLLQMQKVAIRLRMEVDALQAYDIVRKKCQEQRAHV